MRQLTLLIDCDGVVADFILGFTKLANKQFGTPIITTREHLSWGFQTSGLLTYEQEDALWHIVRSDPAWWMGLEPLATIGEFGRINMMQRQHQVVFATSRPADSVPPQWQTKHWLEHQGVHKPCVVTMPRPRKGDIAKALAATHSIEDKLENAWCVHWIADAPQCKSFLIDRPYNRVAMVPEVGARNVVRVASVTEFLDAVEADATR